ncbi:chemotaxis protein CheW [Neobacillus sp. OS1-2]|uniref:chemotaxis protein CheW n=1 Tax=Neobacillus sp. OS1-2 TaxID=3070680 RepID=UPI0027E06D4E|nr:chemotaxis protein CheW [Neobacillus sp. OS1-2]WML39355.1 chemotaxis protein CheW [Neobacillus sp. OS1-2]
MNRKIVAFKLNGEEYGLDIQYVQSIEQLLPITRVPNAPIYVKGVINLRGNVIPVLDLSSKLTLNQATYTKFTRLIITKVEEIEVGLIVDQISDVIDIAEEAIESESSSAIHSEFFEGIAISDGRIIILLNVEELLKTEEVI